MNYYSDTYSKHSKNFILSLATNDFEPMISNDFIKVSQRVANNQFIYKSERSSDITSHSVTL